MMLTPDSFAGPRAFAHAMRGTAWGAPIDAYAWAGGGRVETLFRQSCWQVERVTLRAFAIVPPHRHLRCSSCDLIESGQGEGEVEGRPFRAVLTHARAANLLSVPAGSLHNGAVGADGLSYLSFQRWHGLPSRITEDWQC